MTDPYGVVDGSRQAYHDIRSSSRGADVPHQLPYSVSEGIPLLRVRLLGGFCVQRSDVGQAVCDWQRRSAKALIKILAVQPGTRGAPRTNHRHPLVGCGHRVRAQQLR